VRQRVAQTTLKEHFPMRSLSKAHFVRAVLGCLMAVAVLLGIQAQPQSATSATGIGQSQSVAGAQVELAGSAKMSISSYAKQKSYPFWNSSKAQAAWNADPLGYYKRSCVSYVGWRLLHSNHIKVKAGAATNWGSWARSHDYKIGSTPKKGSVAWWKHGHVAWVEKVSRDGRTAYLREYSWDRYYYFNTRTIKKGKSGWPSGGFILFPMK